MTKKTIIVDVSIDGKKLPQLKLRSLALSGINKDGKTSAIAFMGQAPEVLKALANFHEQEQKFIKNEFGDMLDKPQELQAPKMSGVN